VITRQNVKRPGFIQVPDRSLAKLLHNTYGADYKCTSPWAEVNESAISHQSSAISRDQNSVSGWLMADG
jgi:hypothetical protein